MRALALKSEDLSAYTLAEVLGRDKPVLNEKVEVASAELLSHALYDTIAKFKEVFEANQMLLDDDDENKSVKDLLLIHLRILANAWKSVRGL